MQYSKQADKIRVYVQAAMSGHAVGRARIKNGGPREIHLHRAKIIQVKLRA